MLPTACVPYCRLSFIDKPFHIMPKSFLDSVGFQLIQLIEQVMVKYSPHGDVLFFDTDAFA